MDKICGIYCIENTINHKKYIGLSKNCLKRWQDHYSKSYCSVREDDLNKPLYKAMKKYGRENFSFKIIEECPIEKLQEREIYWIDFLDTYNNGYNATKGGDTADGRDALKGQDHPFAKLTQKEVEQCRIWYKEGYRSKEIYEKYFKDKIHYNSFQKMWHGTTWKNIMPEVFENNPHPRKKIYEEDVIKMKQLFQQGYSCAQVYHFFNEKFSRTTINDIYHGRRYSEILVSDVSTIPEGSKSSIDTMIETDIVE